MKSNSAAVGQLVSWLVPTWAVLDQLLANTHLQGGCVVYYSLQGYTGLIIRNAFAQQYTELDTLSLSSIMYSCRYYARNVYMQVCPLLC